jgi:hypothetical protein
MVKEIDYGNRGLDSEDYCYDKENSSIAQVCSGGNQSFTGCQKEAREQAGKQAEGSQFGMRIFSYSLLC